MRLPAALTGLLAAVALVACGGDDGAAGDAAAPQPASTPAAAPATPQKAASGVLTGTQPGLTGEPVPLERFLGKVVLVVNTASECGYTPQFGGLEELYRRHRDDGLVVLGFPADDVTGQEPRSDAEIAEFCEANYGVTFPMFAKSNVVDDPVNPLFASLAAELGEPSYNFNKYLLDRAGRPVERFDQNVEPEDPELVAAIEAQL